MGKTRDKYIRQKRSRRQARKEGSLLSMVLESISERPINVSMKVKMSGLEKFLLRQIQAKIDLAEWIG